MKRFLLACLVIIGAVAVGAGCSHEGTYELTWSFGPSPATPPSGDGGVEGDGSVDAADAHDGAVGDARDGSREGSVDGATDGVAVDGGAPDGADAEAFDDAGLDGDADAPGAADGGVLDDGGDDAGDVGVVQASLTLADAASADADEPQADGIDAGNSGNDETTASVGCGAHGVFAIRVTGVSSDGKGEDVVVPCSVGRLVRHVSPGTWTLTLHGLDARGRFKEPVTSMILTTTVEGIVVNEDETTHIPNVVLAPEPACRDGVDNDADGRVDLGDPDCQGNPEGGSEGLRPSKETAPD